MNWKRNESGQWRYRRYRLKWSIKSARLLCRNFVVALFDPINVVRDAAIHRRMRRKFVRLAADMCGDTNQIAPTVIFIFGFKGVELFQYYMYLAVASSLRHNPGWRALILYCHEPVGEWWDFLKRDRRVIRHQLPDFQYYGIARVYHYAHKADIVRLRALRFLGGVYLDVDTITARSFAPLQAHRFVMGVQADAPDAKGGLCNAVLMSRRNSAFVKRWLRAYKTFNSKGRDKYWDFHSVKLPAKLSFDHVDEITVLPYDRFFWPLWHDVERVLLGEDSGRYLPQLTDAYVFHLWNSMSEQALVKIDIDYIKRSKSVYASLARDILDGVQGP